MFALQTLKDFLDNPMGKGSTVIPNKQLIKDDLNKRFDKLTKNKKIQFTVYRLKDEYFFHFIIPSESERNNTYDVVLHFTMDEEDFRYDNFLNRYYLKFFSNCPSFTFTYAFAFNMYGMLIDFLGGKYEQIVLEQDPITRNPAEVIGYEKSIYFACYYLMQNKKYLNKMTINSMAKPLVPETLFRSIRSDSKVKLEIDKENSRLKQEKEEADRKANEKKSTDTKKGIRGVSDKEKKTGSVNNHGINRVKPSSKIQARKSTVNKIKPK